VDDEKKEEVENDDEEDKEENDKKIDAEGGEEDTLEKEVDTENDQSSTSDSNLVPDFSCLDNCLCKTAEGLKSLCPAVTVVVRLSYSSGEPLKQLVVAYAICMRLVLRNHSFSMRKESKVGK
jgi:hypothetical protein